MAYIQVLKVLHRSLQHRAPQVSVLIHTHRRVSTLSRLAFHSGLDAHSPVLSCLIQAHRRRGICLDFTARNKSSPEDQDKSVSRYRSGSPKPSAAQKVKEAGRDFTYLIVVLIGLGVTGGLLYVVFQELFSSASPNKVYGRAFDKVKSHPEVIGAFGEPIKCYGETTRRGRRQQVSHIEYLKDGMKHMRLKFYIEGSEPGVKGTVHTESKEAAFQLTPPALHSSLQVPASLKQGEHNKPATLALPPEHAATPLHCSGAANYTSVTGGHQANGILAAKLMNPGSGKYEFRYIFVDMDVYPRRTIIVEDNR